MKTRYFSSQVTAFLIIFFMLISFSHLSAQDFMGLKEVITGSYNVPGSTPEMGITPEIKELNDMGGLMEVTLKYKSGMNQFCESRYSFKWEFNKSIKSFKPAQSIEVTYDSDLVSTDCNSGSAKMIVTDAIGSSSEFKNKNLSGIGGFTVVNKSWISDASELTGKSVIKLISTSNRYATLKLNFESTAPVGSERLHFEVVYIFERDHQPNAKCDEDLNCHNLYSLGVLIGFAEYAALKDNSPAFVAEQLDAAILQAKASNCMPFDKLQELSSKLKNASSSYTYYQEISMLRQKLAVYAEANCNCCGK